MLLGNALTPGRGFRNGPFTSEIELREVVDLAQQRGVVADDERRMIQSVFELGDTPAREVMVPRTEMVWIESDKTAGQATSLAVRSGHSRIPVIGENVDDVVGVVYLKDLCSRRIYSPRRRPYTKVGGGDAPGGVRARLQAARRPASARCSATATTWRCWSTSTAAIAGLVTIEDVLEEIVGEIADEYDTDEVAPVEDLGDNDFRVSARLPIEDVGELFDIEFDEDLDVDTVGGLLALRTRPGAVCRVEVVSHGLRLRAEGGHDHRGRVRIGNRARQPGQAGARQAGAAADD